MAKRTNVAAAPSSFEAMVAETAYYKAEQRGFMPGNELADWLAAEREVHELLSASAPQPVRRRRATTAPRATARTRKAATTIDTDPSAS